jgi:hypothetical protein
MRNLVSTFVVAFLLVASLLPGCGNEPTRPDRAAALPMAAVERSQAAFDSLPQNLAWAARRSRLDANAALHLASNDTPPGAMARLVQSYQAKSDTAYAGMFTGDFHYSFSTVTDPTLAIMYSGGWFKSDEAASSTHLFHGYTPPGGATLSAASSIVIQLANGTPADDNSPGVDPTTHKILSTRVDGSITVPQPGSAPLTYVLSNNLNVFYLVRGDVAAGLDSTQPADSNHWYVYRWDDLTGSQAQESGRRARSQTLTWGRIKALYR